ECTLRMNDIGRVTLTTRESLAVDRYDDVAATGAVILIDEATHQTAAAGMLRDAATGAKPLNFAPDFRVV
ncbi:hypothetical protein LLE87_34595, partial [Paenibacillus polymyxa]|nr:hypothetical protein [Paenibacillus polymyxa]